MADLSNADRIPPAAFALGLASLLPFLLAALAQWVALPTLDSSWALVAATAYGAVILSFLGGVRWGTAIGPYAATRQSLHFGLSVVPALVGWMALLLTPIPALCLLTAGFFMQALWDVMSVEGGRLPPWFGRLRLILTAVVIPSLMAMLARLALA